VAHSLHESRAAPPAAASKRRRRNLEGSATDFGIRLPGTGTTGHLTEPAKVWQRIRKRAGVPDARIHDLRRTLGSWLAAQGQSLPLIGKALNHSNVSTTQIYARLDLEPVRDALENNAALMFGSPADSPLAPAVRGLAVTTLLPELSVNVQEEGRGKLSGRE
jgi:integrase